MTCLHELHGEDIRGGGGHGDNLRTQRFLAQSSGDLERAKGVLMID